MSYIFLKPKRLRKQKSKSAQEVLDKLQSYLDSSTAGTEKILCGFWKDQQTTITYQELRSAVLAGYLSEEIFEQWAKDYSFLVKTQLHDVWRNAISVGSESPKILDGIPFAFNLNDPGIAEWITNRGASFVTDIVEEQRKAIQVLLSQKMIEGHTVDELAKLIRPCIGLTEYQAKANAKYYDNIITSMRKEHPKMKISSIRQKALDSATKYAERQHRQRAMLIAQTESEFAYNRGADFGIRQAQGENLIGEVVKKWSTSGDDGVCDICEALDGSEIGMDEEFSIKGKRLFAGQFMLPPAHPRCACAIEYIETSPPVITGG
jgi:hypothetical protein